MIKVTCINCNIIFEKSEYSINQSRLARKRSYKNNKDAFCCSQTCCGQYSKKLNQADPMPRRTFAVQPGYHGRSKRFFKY